MKYAILHSAASAFFFLIIASIYSIEISTNWSYMGFAPLRSTPAILSVLVVSCVYALTLSRKRDFRNFMQIIMHYAFFVPGLIISATEGADTYYLIILILTYSLVLIFSRFPVRSISSVSLSRRHFFSFVLLSLMAAVSLLAAYGGFRGFNLNIFAVYDFRRDAAQSMPAIFAYFFSGVAKVIAPIALTLAIYFRSYVLAIGAAGLIVLMFGV